MNKRHLPLKLLSGLLNIMTGLLATAVILYSQNWFGSGDTYAFILWTIPLALGLAMSGETMLHLFRTLHVGMRLLLIIVLAGLLSFGWAYGVALLLGVWVGAFSIPVLPLWVVGCIVQLLFLDWRLPKPTGKSKVSKVLFGLLSFPLTLIVGVMAISFFSYVSRYLNRPERETFLFPENFRGAVYIIYNQKNGEPKAYEKKRRIYKIPDNGILFTQFKAEYGRIDHQYFFVDRNGQRTEFVTKEKWTSVKPAHESARDSAAVFGRIAGTMSGSSLTKSTPFHFKNFFVGTYNRANQAKALLSFEKIDSIRTAYLNSQSVWKNAR